MEKLIFDFTGRGETKGYEKDAIDQSTGMTYSLWGDCWADMSERTLIEGIIREHARKGEKIRVRITRMRP